MTDVTTPVPDSTPIGVLIGGKLYGLNLLADTAGADAMGLVADAPAPLTLLGRLKAIATAIGGTLKVAAVDGGALATAAKQDSALALLAKPGLGDLSAVPAGSTNGTAIGAKPGAARAVRLYLPAGSSITFTVASAAPSGAPAATMTVSATDTGPNWDEPLADGAQLYVTARIGAPLFRYL